ncbi:dTDP-4-dehydrorhamnose 3,5-epimerase [Enterobacter cloacae complex sp. 2022EL-00787]|uniref:dTDP-4-dehydrorhamnose 3,5-epimerase n=1 Tax=Enterobacter cloacae complex sp. 2022EL-00787 TaxID=2998098 RepID=UPI002271AE92|nr:dTDP-4-dehydrorhamnose 3,5-epimerase [Enterobacter cloacae complex sp. 2022EL-00787]MCY0770062.1 dTDP-4-dehydrorhamnose 3,5-epimerase [Enterobacter cloacae complex sp. 2022EL-00787]
MSKLESLPPVTFGDERGFFMETWQQKKFCELVCERNFVQDNHSKSARNILRGLHYQTQNPQGKLVRVVSGEVFDVAVDMRKSSATFGRWTGIMLSAENKRQLWIPEGFAHGFYVLSESAEFVYKCTDYYNPLSEHSLLWNDDSVGIKWPLIDGELPLLSSKDSLGKTFADSVYFD